MDDQIECVHVQSYHGIFLKSFLKVPHGYIVLEKGFQEYDNLKFARGQLSLSHFWNDKSDYLDNLIPLP